MVSSTNDAVRVSKSIEDIIYLHPQFRELHPILMAMEP